MAARIARCIFSSSVEPNWLDSGAIPVALSSGKVSGTTVERIPALYEEFGYGRLEAFVPRPLLDIQVAEVALTALRKLLGVTNG